MYRPGALRILINELSKYKIDIAAIQEMRWPNKGTMNHGNYTVFYSGNDQNKKKSGTGFIVNARLRPHIIGFNACNERMSSLRIQAKFQNITVFSIYAPTEEADDHVKDVFYSDLENFVDKTPKYDVKIILGDFNAKIGKDPNYADITGLNSLHDQSNNNGERIIDFAVSKSLVVSSTAFPRKNIYKETWKSPDKRTRNQIDHALVDHKHRSSIINVKTQRGADADSDHYMVKVVYRARISNIKTHKATRANKYNINLLKDSSFRDLYQSKIDEQLKAMYPHNDNRLSCEDDYNSLTNILNKTAEDVLGYERVSRSKPWFDQECNAVIIERNNARKLMLQKQTRFRVDDYKDKRRIANRILKKKKKEHLKQKINNIEEARQNNDVRKFYKDINDGRKTFKPRSNICKSEDGTLLCNKEQVLKRWKEFFEKTLNTQSDENEYAPKVYHTVEPLVIPPTMDEVQSTINRLKNLKAPGVDSIPSELIKLGGDSLHREIYHLILKVWETEKMPSKWHQAIICPLLKKGDPTDCKNYRAISLLCTMYKVFSMILHSRLEPYAEECIGDYQCGFRRGRSTTDQIFSLRHLMEKCYEFQINTHYIFIDFRQAFDSIHRANVLSAMQEFGIPQKLINLTSMTLDGSFNSIRIEGELSQSFETKNGVKQGDNLAPLIFNIAIEKILQMAGYDKNSSIFIKSFQVLAYADDLVLIGRNENILKEKFMAIASAAKQFGLEINASKTKYMQLSKQPRSLTALTIGDTDLESVTSFSYLGTTVDNSSSCSREIQNRIKSGNKCYFALLPMMKSRLLSRTTKIRIYKTLIRPVITYGSDAWVINKCDEKRLLVFERKILRRIYGPMLEEGAPPRIRYNDELYALFNDLNLVAFIKCKMMKWAGHIVRMNATRMVSCLFNGCPVGKRFTGRPRTRWKDCCDKVMASVGITNWKIKARSRSGWRKIVKEAMAHPGLSSQR